MRLALLRPGVELRHMSCDVDAAIAEHAVTGMPGVERVVVRAPRGDVAPDAAVESQRGA